MSFQLDEARAVLRRGVRSRRYRGVQLHVMHGGSESTVCIGEARDGTLLTPTSRVPWLCSSKLVVAYLALHLAEVGLLDVATPLGEVLDTRSSRLGRIRLWPLLVHEVTFLDDPPAAAAIPLHPDEQMELALGAIVTEEGAPNYSVWYGPTLVAHACATLVGRPLRSVVDDFVLRHAGLSASGFGQDSVGTEDRVDLYRGGRWTPGRTDAELRVASCDVAVGARGPMSELAQLLKSLSGEPWLSRVLSRHVDGDHWSWGMTVQEVVGGARSQIIGQHGDVTAAWAWPDADLVVAVFFNGLTNPLHHALRSHRLLEALVEDLSLSDALSSRGAGWRSRRTRRFANVAATR